MPGKESLHIEPLENRCLLSAGSLDAVFGGSGQAVAAFTPGTSQVNAIAVQGDGKVVVVGESGASPSTFALARFNRDGSLDASFGTAGKVTLGLGSANNGVAKGVAIQADGKIVVAGFTGASGKEEFALARFNADGSLDKSFGTGGSVLTDFGGTCGANSVTLQADGKIIAAGSLQPSPASSFSCFALARYNTDGSLDTSFGSGGKVTTQFSTFDAAANQVLIQPNGKIVAAGHTSTSSGFFNFALARYNPDGSADTTFNLAGKVVTHFGTFDDAHGLVLQSDGKLVAVGSFSTGSKVDIALARYNTNGTLDSTFGFGGTVTTDFGGLNQAANGAVLQADGKILIAGVFAPQGPSQFLIARYKTDGSLDSGFGTNGLVTSAFASGASSGANSVALLADVTLVAGGVSANSFALARYWGDNSPPDYALGSPNAIYVNQVYLNLLGRPVDPSGVMTWTNALSGGATRADIVQAIEASTEYRTRLLDNLYETLLGRAPDPTGMNSFLSALASGATIEQVKAGILSSPEYFQRAGGNNSAFLSAIYHDVLRRAVDPTGAAVWGSQLLGNVGRNVIASAIVTSGEADQDLVQQDYQQFLHRPADPVGLAAWTTQLEQGTRDEAILAALIGSGEFFGGL